jgi:hypothetical protein
MTCSRVGSKYPMRVGIVVSMNAMFADFYQVSDGLRSSTLLRRPGAGRDPDLPWIPAFAGMTRKADEKRKQPSGGGN